MKKTFALLVLFAMMLSSLALAESGVDLSPFEDNPSFEMDVDANGIVTIICTEGVGFYGSADGDDGILLGIPDIKIIGSDPPVFHIPFMYSGTEPITPHHFILKPADTTYSFPVLHQNTLVDGEKVSVSFGLVLNENSMQLLEEIVNGNITSISFQMQGERNLEGVLSLVNPEVLANLYNTYKLTGILNTDLSSLYDMFPCTIY